MEVGSVTQFDPAPLALLINERSRDLTRPCIVAVDGRSGVGKSTFAESLAKRGDASILTGDDFYAGGTSVRTDPLESRALACIDWQRQAAVLKVLRAGRQATWQAFDWERFDGSPAPELRSCRPDRVVVLEGVYSARPELADLLDIRVLLQIPEPQRIKQLLEREGELTDWERGWHEAEDYYFEHIRRPQDFELMLSRRG